jgi:hypothetical protein
LSELITQFLDLEFARHDAIVAALRPARPSSMRRSPELYECAARSIKERIPRSTAASIPRSLQGIEIRVIGGFCAFSPNALNRGECEEKRKILHNYSPRIRSLNVGHFHIAHVLGVYSQDFAFGNWIQDPLGGCRL